MMNRTSSGVDLYSRLTISELVHTDLPEPVVPAISRWGIFATSQYTASPEISRPRPTDSIDRCLPNSGVSISSRIDTPLFTELGTSMPTAALPGMGASIRTWVAAKFRAISSDKLVILEIRTPAAGFSSYRVTVGPRLMSVMVASTLKEWRVSISRSALDFSSPLTSFTDLCWAGVSRDTGGSL